MAEIDWSTLKLLAKRTGLSIHLELMEYWAGDPNPVELCSLIDQAVDQCAATMAMFPKEYDPQKEDQLTIALIVQLDKFGFNVSHDATSGGHCDIVIRDAGNFLWLGEAKKVSSVDNNWIAGGFDQLMVRYATGLPAQDSGSLIIFCNCSRVDQILTSWKEYLLEKYDGVSISAHDHDEIWYRSERISERTGRPYRVRHKPISVYFPPLHGETSLKTA
jgi:hypothetical protein